MMSGVGARVGQETRSLPRPGRAKDKEILGTRILKATDVNS